MNYENTDLQKKKKKMFFSTKWLKNHFFIHMHIWYIIIYMHRYWLDVKFDFLHILQISRLAFSNFSVVNLSKSVRLHLNKIQTSWRVRHSSLSWDFVDCRARARVNTNNCLSIIVYHHLYCYIVITITVHNIYIYRDNGVIFIFYFLIGFYYDCSIVLLYPIRVYIYFFLSR